MAHTSPHSSHHLHPLCSRSIFLFHSSASLSLSLSRFLAHLPFQAESITLFLSFLLFHATLSLSFSLHSYTQCASLPSASLFSLFHIECIPLSFIHLSDCIMYFSPSLSCISLYRNIVYASYIRFFFSVLPPLFLLP